MHGPEIEESYPGFLMELPDYKEKQPPRRSVASAAHRKVIKPYRAPKPGD